MIEKDILAELGKWYLQREETVRAVNLVDQKINELKVALLKARKNNGNDQHNPEPGNSAEGQRNDG